MATKKVTTKRHAPKTHARKAKPADGSKPVVKRALAKKTAVKSAKFGAQRKSTVSISAKPAATCAAEVESNMGGSRALTDFLNDIDWYK